MSSKKTIKVKTRSYKHRKKWLAAKVQQLKSYYEEVLSAFKLKLDNIVNPVIDDASRILSEENQTTFLKDVYEVGIGVERCMNDLFEINLLCCDSSYSSDDQSDHDSEDENVHPVTSVVPSTQCLSSRGFPTTDSSSPPCVKSPSKLIDKPASTPTKLEPSANNCPSSDCSPTQADSALALQSSCGKNVHLFSAEIDLLLLHNIKFGEKRAVLVSDVISPNSFSVQPEECKNQLTNLQQSLNTLYSEQWTEQLQFVEKPKVGTICVAKFTIDHCWYRAKILKELPNNKYEVMYIDYGNRTMVKMEDLRVIDPGLGNIPQLSIQCSLFGVEPVSGKNDSNSEWSLPATEWFDQQVFGKQFIVQFAPHPTSSALPCYSAHLFTAVSTPDGEQTSWSVADNMVCMGFAAFATALPAATSSEKGDAIHVPEEKRSCIPQRTLTRQVSQPSCSNDLLVIPAGMESGDKNGAFQKSNVDSQELVPNTHKFRMPLKPLRNLVQKNVLSQNVHRRPMPVWLSPICSSVALVDSRGRVYQQAQQRCNF